MHLDRREARAYKPPRSTHGLALDLNEGFADFQWRGRSERAESGIGGNLEWVLGNRDVFSRLGAEPGVSHGPLHTNFVLFRNAMADILGAPYAQKKSKPWQMLACKLHNTIFLCKDIEFAADAEEDYEGKLEMTHHGYRFQNLLSAHIDPDVRAAYVPCDSAGFMTFVRRHLGDHSLIVSGNVDAEKEDVQDAPQKYVELRTHKQHSTNSFERFKLPRVWAQCYALGTPTVVFGLKDDQGIVRSLKIYQTSEIPDGSRHWQSTVCLNFLGAVSWDEDAEGGAAPWWWQPKFPDTGLHWNNGHVERGRARRLRNNQVEWPTRLNPALIPYFVLLRQSFILMARQDSTRMAWTVLHGSEWWCIINFSSFYLCL